MRDPVTDLDRRGRIIFGAVIAFAAIHALLYVLTIPTWDLFDEEQHLSYSLYLIDDGELPRVADSVQPRILESALATERWSTLRIGRPVAPELNEFGLEGLTYEAYHPPLYYLLVSPLTLLSDSDAWRELYAVRLFGIALLVAIAGICWGFARDWLPDADPSVWGTVAVIGLSVPSVAAAAGRVNNDLLAGLFVASGTLMASRLLEERRTDQAFYTGTLAALAILTKGQGAVLLPVIGVTLFILLLRQQLTIWLAVLALTPGLGAIAGWAAWTFQRYNTVNGANAYLDLVGSAEPLGAAEFVRELWLNSWSSYWGAYDGGALEVVTGIIIALTVVAGSAGLYFGVNRWTQPGKLRDRLILTSTLVAGMLAAIWVANDSGLAHPHGRMLIGVFPSLITISLAGVQNLLGSVAVVQIGVVFVSLSAVYFLFWYLPFFY